MLQAVRDIPGLSVRSLYELYPDFGIDVEAEQEALLGANLVIWQHPMYWYTVPGLLKHWFDKVLARGWAYGEGGTALAGKRCLWATTTGGDERAFSAEGMHTRPFSSFVHVVEQTALFCGMRWEEPFVVHGAHRIPKDELDETARRYRRRIEGLMTETQEES
jgi:glutathione-regulated potassium-efflux system ancillary protein KefF